MNSGVEPAVTVVLVHGSLHGAWAWERVEPGLTAGGVRVAAVDLPGRGASVARRPGLAESISVVREAIDSAEGPVVVCAHSAGGYPAAYAAAGDARVKALVLIAALVPGESDVAMAVAAASGQHLVLDGSSMRIASTSVARQLFYSDCTSEDAAWATDRLVGEPLPDGQPDAALPAEEDVAPWGRVSTTFVVCEGDQVLPAQLQETMAAKADHVVRLPTAHSPFLSAPDSVVSVLLDAARRLTSSGAQR